MTNTTPDPVVEIERKVRAWAANIERDGALCECAALEDEWLVAIRQLADLRDEAIKERERQYDETCEQIKRVALAEQERDHNLSLCKKIISQRNAARAELAALKKPQPELEKILVGMRDTPQAAAIRAAFNAERRKVQISRETLANFKGYTFGGDDIAAAALRESE